MSVDLFSPIIPSDRYHPQFGSLLNSADHACARELMNALFARMRASDRNFVHDFQGAGFHARLFEICCFAYLEACGLQVDRSQPYPDFMARRGDDVVAIEVVTSNPADGEDRNVSAARMTPLTEEEVCDKASTEFQRRVLRGLTRKLRRKYHEHSHVGGRPLVFMVAPFHEPGASFYVEDSLLPALFPFEPNPPELPFFEMEGSEDVSAVAYCNAFTVSKLWRMADPEFIAENFIAERSGHAFFEGSDKLHGFRYRVGHELTPRETWFEGLSLIVNPRATIPLPDILPASSTVTVVDDQLNRRIKGFHPLASAMIVYPRAKISG